MKITREQKYIGAAIMQVSEHREFTSINLPKFKHKGKININNIFKINKNILLYCKYATRPNEQGEFVFTFHRNHYEFLKKFIESEKWVLFCALVIVEEREICCLNEDEIDSLLEFRQNSAGFEEEQYQFLVTAERGRQLEVYVNAYNERGRIAGKALKIPRNAFPNKIFS